MAKDTRKRAKIIVEAIWPEDVAKNLVVSSRKNKSRPVEGQETVSAEEIDNIRCKYLKNGCGLPIPRGLFKTQL